MGAADDIRQAFYLDGIAAARRLLMRGHEVDLFRPLMNESALSFKAHNSQGNAAGIFQAMPLTLKNLGFQGDWRDFVALDADAQLPWLEKYYAPARGHLINAISVYAWTFCPAFIIHASQEDWIICAADGRSGGLDLAHSKFWYSQNTGLDVNGDMVIDMADLGRAIARADQGPRWQEISAELTAAIALADVPDAPDTDSDITPLPPDLDGVPYERSDPT